MHLDYDGCRRGCRSGTHSDNHVFANAGAVPITRKAAGGGVAACGEDSAASLYAGCCVDADEACFVEELAEASYKVKDSAGTDGVGQRVGDDPAGCNHSGSLREVRAQTLNVLAKRPA